MKTVTLGMFAVGIVILAARVTWWWRKGGKASKDWRGLAPFALSALAFAAAGACAGGLLGTVLTWARNGVGHAGDWGIKNTTGYQTVSVSRPSDFGTLTPFGAVIMLVLLTVFIVLWKTARRKPKKELTWGAPVGLTLGPFLGAVSTTPLINHLGALLIAHPFFHQ